MALELKLGAMGLEAIVVEAPSSAVVVTESNGVLPSILTGVNEGSVFVRLTVTVSINLLIRISITASIVDELLLS